MPEDHVCQHSEGGNVRQAGALSITLQPAFVRRWPKFFRGLLDTSALRSRLFSLRIFVMAAATADSSEKVEPLCWRCWRCKRTKNRSKRTTGYGLCLHDAQ